MTDEEIKELMKVTSRYTKEYMLKIQREDSDRISEQEKLLEHELREEAIANDEVF
ncbi:MAG: hypothetical protein U0L98_03120 [Clostridia bacterium]|nr:hypothetical protein [Clostridia bacterium]